MVLESNKKGLQEERELLERGKREAAEEADKLDGRREVTERLQKYMQHPRSLPAVMRLLHPLLHANRRVGQEGSRLP